MKIDLHMKGEHLDPLIKGGLFGFCETWNAFFDAMVRMQKSLAMAEDVSSLKFVCFRVFFYLCLAHLSSGKLKVFICRLKCWSHICRNILGCTHVLLPCLAGSTPARLGFRHRI